MLLGWILPFRQKRRRMEKSQPVRQTENPGCTKTAKQWCSREQLDFPVFLVFMLTSLSVISLKTVWKIKFTKQFLTRKQQINRLFPQIQQTSENLAQCRHLVRGAIFPPQWCWWLSMAFFVNAGYQSFLVNTADFTLEVKSFMSLPGHLGTMYFIYLFSYLLHFWLLYFLLFYLHLLLCNNCIFLEVLAVKLIVIPFCLSDYPNVYFNFMTCSETIEIFDKTHNTPKSWS